MCRHIWLFCEFSSFFDRSIGLDAERSLRRTLVVPLWTCDTSKLIGANVCTSALHRLVIDRTLLELFLLNEIEIVRVEYDFLDLFLRKQAREEVAAVEWICLCDMLAILLIWTEHISICCHFFFQDEEVHDLVVHRHRVSSLIDSLHSCKLVRCLPCVDFEGLHTFSKLTNFFVNSV